MSIARRRAPRLVLASASPRRSYLLNQLGLRFEIDAPEIDEAPRKGMTPEEAVIEIAIRKLVAVRARRPRDVVIAADTTVLLGRRWIGKPESAKEARRSLASLSGRTHRVLTGVAAAGPEARIHAEVVETRVKFLKLSAARIRAYVATREPMGKAGAYAIQGAGAAFVESIDGDPSNVVGLPLASTLRLLRKAGLPLPTHLRA